MQDDSRTCQPVVQKLSISVNKRPEYSARQKQQGWPRERVSQQRPADSDWPTVGANDAQFPGLHGQRLPATEPARDEVASDNQEQIKLEDVPGNAREPPVCRSVKCQTGEKCDGEHY